MRSEHRRPVTVDWSSGPIRRTGIGAAGYAEVVMYPAAKVRIVLAAGTLGLAMVACQSSHAPAPGPSAPDAARSIWSAPGGSDGGRVASPSTSTAPPPTKALSASPAQVPSAPAPTRSAGLTSRQLAGQRIIYSYPGLTPPASLLRIIRAGEAAGVIFFGENIAGTAQIRSVIAQLRRARAQSPVHVPLLLMVDQEGGLIRRLPGAPALSEKRIGQSADRWPPRPRRAPEPAAHSPQ
jgi:beta-N-acetylhexosaminidase